MLDYKKNKRTWMLCWLVSSQLVTLEHMKKGSFTGIVQTQEQDLA
jgi:hypothetical protein